MQPQIRRVEEDHLPQFRVEHVEVELHDRRVAFPIEDRELQLDALSVLQDAQGLCHSFVVEQSLALTCGVVWYRHGSLTASSISLANQPAPGGWSASVTHLEYLQR